MAGVQVLKRINMAALEHPDTRKSLSYAFDSLQFDGSWYNFREHVYSVEVDVLGLMQKQHRDWFDKNDRYSSRNMNFINDDAVFIAHSVEHMQLIMDCFSFAGTAFRLTISLKKTKVMFTPAPGEPYNEPNIVINDTRLDVVDTLAYLGSTLSRDGSLDAEIHLSIQKASVAFEKLEREYGLIVLFLRRLKSAYISHVF